MDRLIDRFDMNKDGIVDYVDFLRFLTGVCDDSHRRVKRVMEAALEIQTWAIEKQSKKDAKEGNIDTSSSWKLLKPSDGIIAIANVDSVRFICINTCKAITFVVTAKKFDSTKCQRAKSIVRSYCSYYEWKNRPKELPQLCKSSL